MFSGLGKIVGWGLHMEIYLLVTLVILLKKQKEILVNMVIF